ncbi:hypothetical protein niasHS_006163 [Heterodera schachtii]|uniref:Protein FAM91A1 n=1 Tax=Heterodera schachtii TaxID=97005 RepID=A0ABD2JWS8_HETSC
MTSDEVEDAIRKNIIWAKLADELRIMLGNSQREYDKRILDYSIKNQLRYRDNIVRFVKRSQEEYYDSLLSYSQQRMMLYPYHLSDILVRELRITPFTYYTNMIVEVMQAEKSYDSIPNFTAVDVMRMLGIGRNQYIDLMNQNRANRRLFRRAKPVREILPQKPCNFAPIEPWFHLCFGCILEADIRMLSSPEQQIIDRLLDEGSVCCGLLDKAIVLRLLSRGLVYLEVPIGSDDYVFVPTLDGFVMNRVQGDYFETLLYKIFVAIDGQTSVMELADTIGIDINLVKNAVSVFCRLGFARKRVTGIENVHLHASWATGDYANADTTGTASSGLASPSSDQLSVISANAQLADLSVALLSTTGEDGANATGTDEVTDDDDDIVTAVENALKGPPQNHRQQQTPGTELGSKRIAFIFDSSLTAFLMMGNLSATLKNHAVTLFEVGKLSDEALDSFIDELQNVNLFVEGEAQRYSEHARTLLYTLQSLRAGGAEMDLIRGESLHNLDPVARTKVVQRAYKLLVSMAPINADACCVPLASLPHLGTASIELSSPWFRLFLYELAGNGPPALFLPLGTRLGRLPKLFWHSRRLMLTQGTHEPLILPVENALVPTAEALVSAPVFIQAYSELASDAEVVNVPFPFLDDDEHADDDNDTKQDAAVHDHCHNKVAVDATDDALLQNGDVVRHHHHYDANTSNDNDGTASDRQDETVHGATPPAPSELASFSRHPIVRKLRELLHLDHLCGYIVLLKLHHGTTAPSSRLPTETADPLRLRKTCSNRTRLTAGESMDDYVLFDCVFGIPLFDEALNKTICQRIMHKQLCSTDNFQNVLFTMQHIIDSTREFVARFQDNNNNNITSLVFDDITNAAATTTTTTASSMVASFEQQQHQQQQQFLSSSCPSSSISPIRAIAFDPCCCSHTLTTTTTTTTTTAIGDGTNAKQQNQGRKCCCFYWTPKS